MPVLLGWIFSCLEGAIEAAPVQKPSAAPTEELQVKWVVAVKKLPPSHVPAFIPRHKPAFPKPITNRAVADDDTPLRLQLAEYHPPVKAMKVSSKIRRMRRMMFQNLQTTQTCLLRTTREQTLVFQTSRKQPLTAMGTVLLM